MSDVERPVTAPTGVPGVPAPSARPDITPPAPPAAAPGDESAATDPPPGSGPAAPGAPWGSGLATPDATSPGGASATSAAAAAPAAAPVPGGTPAADRAPAGPPPPGTAAADVPPDGAGDANPPREAREAGLAAKAEARPDPDETPPVRRILEAILLVVDQPVPAVELAQVVEQPRAAVEAALAELAADYRAAGRGFELREVAGGWRFYTAADCAAYVERFVLDGQQARLTQAALETLAVVAYRQPVSRQAIAAIRGVNVDGVVRTLLGRGLIAEAGQEGPGGAHLYVTTPYFLERLGLRSLDELPNLAPLLPVNLDDLTDHA